MAALGRKQNIAQQMGQYGQISHLSLTELYSSLGLVILFILKIPSLSLKICSGRQLLCPQPCPPKP